MPTDASCPNCGTPADERTPRDGKTFICVACGHRWIPDKPGVVYDRTEEPEKNSAYWMGIAVVVAIVVVVWWLRTR